MTEDQGHYVYGLSILSEVNQRSSCRSAFSLLPFYKFSPVTMFYETIPFYSDCTNHCRTTVKSHQYFDVVCRRPN